MPCERVAAMPSHVGARRPVDASDRPPTAFRARARRGLPASLFPHTSAPSRVTLVRAHSFAITCLLPFPRVRALALHARVAIDVVVDVDRRSPPPELVASAARRPPTRLLLPPSLVPAAARTRYICDTGTILVHAHHVVVPTLYSLVRIQHTASSADVSARSLRSSTTVQVPPDNGRTLALHRACISRKHTDAFIYTYTYTAPPCRGGRQLLLRHIPNHRITHGRTTSSPACNVFTLTLHIHTNTYTYTYTNTTVQRRWATITTAWATQ
jgi:hypothetical protein